jgi:hypothetical protein
VCICGIVRILFYVAVGGVLLRVVCYVGSVLLWVVCYDGCIVCVVDVLCG